MRSSYNLKHLVKIIVVDKKENEYYQYKKEKKFLGLTIRREGIHGGIDGEYYKDIESLNKSNGDCDKYQLHENKIFRSPGLSLFFTNDISLNLYTNTLEDALKKEKEIRESCDSKFITILNNDIEQ